MSDQPETWRRSSFSGASDECVELSNTGLVRDSKDSDGPALRADLVRLLAATKSGTLDC